MEAGRELDKLIAEKVMGWEIGALNGRRNVSPCGSKWSTERDSLGGVPEYSADIAAAWEVVEAIDLFGDGWCDRSIKKNWRNNFVVTEKIQAGMGTSTEEIAEADTAALVICLAALKVKGVGL